MGKYIECQTILVPANKSRIAKHENKLHLAEPYSLFSEFVGYEPQHLYIVSDEEINKGDWFYADEYAPIEQAKSIEGNFVNGFIRKYCKKVVAATDPSLKLPPIPDYFLEEYVESNGVMGAIEILRSDNGELSDYVGSKSKRDLLEEFDKKYVHVIDKEQTKKDVSTSDVFITELSNALNHLDALDSYHSLAGKSNLLGKYHEQEEECIEKLKLSLDKLRKLTQLGWYQSEQMYAEELKSSVVKPDTLEELAKKYGMQNMTFETHSYPLIITFKAGYHAHEQQSANDTIEFAEWLRCSRIASFIPTVNGWDWWHNEDDRIITSQQLYELWQQSKK